MQFIGRADFRGGSRESGSGSKTAIFGAFGRYLFGTFGDTVKIYYMVIM